MYIYTICSYIYSIFVCVYVCIFLNTHATCVIVIVSLIAFSVVDAWREPETHTYIHTHTYVSMCILFRSSVVFVLSFALTSVVVFFFFFWCWFFLRCLSVWRFYQGFLFRLFEISATPFSFWRTCCASLSSAGSTTTTATTT